MSQTRTELPRRLWKPTGMVRHEELGELSGLVASRRYPGILWGHNDSGDHSRLFALRADGTVVAEVEIDGAANKDWEDIALDRGTLWVSDLGNNDNKRHDLCVYKLTEPAPKKGRTRAQKIRVAYPDQVEFPPKKSEWRYDCEAVFVFQRKLHILTKHRLAGSPFFPSDSTVLYRLDQESLKHVNSLTPLDQRSGLGGWVTAADISPNGLTLAVLTHLPIASVWLFDVRDVTEKLLSKPIKRQVLDKARQCEALCFLDDQTLLLGNEQRELCQLRLADFPPVTTPHA